MKYWAINWGSRKGRGFPTYEAREQWLNAQPEADKRQTEGVYGDIGWMTFSEFGVPYAIKMDSHDSFHLEYGYQGPGPN